MQFSAPRSEEWVAPSSVEHGAPRGMDTRVGGLRRRQATYAAVQHSRATLGQERSTDVSTVLRDANRKFEGRFRRVERDLAAEALTAADVDIERLEALWQAAKRQD